MRALKLKNKLNCAMVIFLGLTLSVHSASAVILDGYTKYYTPEEIIVNNIIGNVFIYILYISAPMFIFGIVRDLKNKKNKKNFSMILFIGAFFSYFFISFVILMISTTFLIGYIYNFYPYFVYVVIGVYLFFICVFAKISAKILKSDFFIVLSLFLIIISMFISKSIT
ncbi:MAG: hypothetical protein KAU07_00655 [Candidatus Andersenbacteria bacterium]|nr:hypothetical protein [Candidatus Andersenbacteria bacterium]